MAKYGGKPADSNRSDYSQLIAIAAFCLLLASTTPADAQTIEDDTSSTDSAQTTAFGLSTGTEATTSTASGTTVTQGTTTTTSAASGTKDLSSVNPVTVRISDEDLANQSEDLGRLNLREGKVDNQKTASTQKADDDGISIGTMRLRTSLTQSYGYEQKKTDTTTSKRSFLETGLKGTLTSDWSRHQLTITGEGIWQKNLSGDLEENPSASLDAELRLDLSNDTTVKLKAGYDFSRVDADNPNAVSNAVSQSDVHTFSTGVSASHDLGLLRGTAGLDVSRSIYTGAKLADGSTLSQSDRNADTVAGTARLGYELSPALVPFIEASAGRTFYDHQTDSSGYERSYNSYSAIVGVEFDGGDKLSGELGAGYEITDFDDNRLETIGGLKVEGNILWSPLRGTSVDTTLSTTVEPSTSGGESGSTLYALNSTLTQEMRDNLVSRLSGKTTYRDYGSSSSSSDQYIWSVGAGLTWKLNRYLELGGDLTYQYTDNRTGSDTEDLTAKVGLTLKR